MIDFLKYKTVWEQTVAADEYRAVEAGEYICSVSSESRPWTASTGTDAFKICFVIEEGTFKGRKVFYDVFITDKNMPNAKRDFLKLGFNRLEDLNKPISVSGRFLVGIESYEEGGRARTRAFQFVNHH